MGSVTSGWVCSYGACSLDQAMVCLATFDQVTLIQCRMGEFGLRKEKLDHVWTG